MNRAAAFVLLGLASLGCWQYRAGYCDENHTDCDSTSICHPELHRCVPKTGAGGHGGQDGGLDSGRDGARDVPVDKGPPPCSVDANSCGGETPVCDSLTHACRGCKSNTECTTTGKPVCAITGDGGTTGVCVECTQNSDCKDTAPVCNKTLHTCSACTTDDDCKLFDPGVCKTLGPGNNGRCVRPDETIYVSKSAGCSDTLAVVPQDGGAPDAGAPNGVSTRPFCSMEPIRAVLSPSRYVVLVSGQVTGADWSYNNEAQGPVLIVGRTGTISGAADPNFQMTSGNVTIRNLTFSPGGKVGIEADGGNLSLSRVTISGCQGGGLWLNGAAFDVENSTISGNGPGDHNGSIWGGILETALGPATGTTANNISQVSVLNNMGQDITCKDGLVGRDVLVYDSNKAVQVSPGCNLLLCMDAGAMCGAQP